MPVSNGIRKVPPRSRNSNAARCCDACGEGSPTAAIRWIWWRKRLEDLTIEDLNGRRFSSFDFQVFTHLSRQEAQGLPKANLPRPIFDLRACSEPNPFHMTTSA